MKYFTFSEVISAIPVSLLFGLAFAFLYRLLISVFLCLSVSAEFKNYLNARLNKRRYHLDFGKYNDLGKTKYSFVISEIAGFLLAVTSGIAFSVLLYILSDGIPRLYILFFVLLGFSLSIKLLHRPLNYISFLFSKLAYGVLFKALYLLVCLPIKLYKRVEKYVKKHRENH